MEAEWQAQETARKRKAAQEAATWLVDVGVWAVGQWGGVREPNPKEGTWPQAPCSTGLRIEITYQSLLPNPKCPCL